MKLIKSYLSASSLIVAVGLLLDEFSEAFTPKLLKPTSILPLFSTAEKTDTDLFKVNIALTREVNKNSKLKEMIGSHPTTKMLENSMKVNCFELPCIEHATGPDLESFQQFVNSDDGDDQTNSLSRFDYIVITSPESAKVFSDVVKTDNDMMNGIKIAAVGKATKNTLTNLGFHVDFVPSKATGDTLGEELPPIDKVKLTRVLYPASAKAENTIQEKLEERKDASFSVTRFNTYDTVPVKLPEKQMEMAMDDIQIVCFGSPSSVDAWLENVDSILGIEGKSDEDKKATPGANGNAIAVCIGSTSARRCLESGRWQAMDIYYPKSKPGIEGWADSCLQAAGDVLEKSFWD